MERGEARFRSAVDESVSRLGGVVDVAYAVDAVEVRVGRAGAVHHPSEIVETTDVRDSFLNGFLVVVDPFDEHVAFGGMVCLAAERTGCVGDGEGSPGYFEGEGGLECGLGLGVEVDA